MALSKQISALRPTACRVQLRRSAGWRLPPNTAVITRATKRWGNPFVIGRDSIYGYVTDAATAVLFYRRWLETTTFGADLLAAARRELTGKNLACFCGLDRPCHGDVLLELLNSIPAGGRDAEKRRISP